MEKIFIVHCKSIKIERSLTILIRIPQGDITKGDGVGEQSLGT